MSDLATLRLRERAGLVIAAITGEVDVSNSGRLKGELTESVTNAARGLLVDLSEIEFLDSSGVHLLYDLAERLANRRQGFAVVLPRDRPPRRALELSGVEPIRWLHEDHSSALAGLGGD